MFQIFTDFAKEIGLFGIVAVLGYAFIRYWRGRTGHGDLAFLILRLYPVAEDGTRKMEACTIHVSTLPEVVKRVAFKDV